MTERETIAVSKFIPEQYPPAILDLLREPRLQSLGPGRPNLAVKSKLQAVTIEPAFAPGQLRDRDMAKACLAGIWLYHDFLDDSHQISQAIESVEGSYWHG